MNHRLQVLGLAALVALGCLAAGRTPAQGPAAKGKAPFKVKVVGKGRPMILIPGLTCSGEVWDSTVEHFKGKYECHVLTLAGFAGQPPIEGPFLQTMRQAIARYIRDKKLTRPVIVGHSLGGFLAFALAIHEPDLVGPLVSVDGLPCLPALFNPKIDSVGLKKQAEAMRKQMTGASRKEFLAGQEKILAFWVSDKKNLEKVKKWAADSDRATVIKAFTELFSQDLRAEVSRIKSPVLLLGAYDKSMASLVKREDVVKNYTAQVAKIPRHKVAVPDNARHFLMFDVPKWMFEQMDSFLKGE
jgi:pimeloyl-ACP methyl ester carboxylesterase